MAGALFAAVLSVLVFGPVTAARAHPGVHERIDRATERLERRPTAGGHLERALLYLEHRELEAARADIEAAERLEGETPDTRWLAIRVTFEGARYDRVLERIGRLEPDEAESPRALLMKSRALAGAGRLREADAAMQDALAALAPPSVDLYLEAAALRTELGDAEEARQVLAAGIADHPRSVPLRVAAFRSDRDRGAHREALADLNGLSSELRSTPHYLVERARLERALGREAEARRAYEEAREALSRYPEARRRSPAMREIEAAIEAESPEADPDRGAPAEAPPSPWPAAVAGLTVAVLCLSALGWWWKRRRRASA